MSKGTIASLKCQDANSGQTVESCAGYLCGEPTIVMFVPGARAPVLLDTSEVMAVLTSYAESGVTGFDVAPTSVWANAHGQCVGLGVNLSAEGDELVSVHLDGAIVALVPLAYVREAVQGG
jgi:hypothetical protein